MRIEPFGQGLGRIADPREPGIETVKAGREGVLHDLAGDLFGSKVECVGERSVQVLRELKRRGQSLDEKVLSLGRDDAVRVDTASMTCSLRDLFASMPEIDDLFAEVFAGPPGWVSVANDDEGNARGTTALNATPKKASSTYGLFLDRSGEISIDSLKRSGWPLAEIRPVDDYDRTGTAFRARVDHAGHDIWWKALPTHSSPFRTDSTLQFPTLGGLREYRTIAAVTLYALSIIARYLPSAWRPIEGGDEDQYLALVQASLAVWERLLPEQFLESIAGETVHTAQPGSLLA